MTVRLLFALALLPLAACGDADDTVVADADDVAVVTDDAVMGDDVLINDDVALDDAGMAAADDVTAEGTIDAAVAAGGLTSLAPDAAVANIDAWIAKLTGVDGAEGVVDGLGTLKTQLTTDPLDGAAIGATLSSLGEQTTAAAGGDAALESLGRTLSEAGNTLQGN